MTPQSTFMILAPLADGQEASVAALLASMNGATGMADPENALVPFGRFEQLHVARFAMQSEGYAQALRELGIPSEKIAVTGSVKYDGVLGDRNNPQTRRLGEQLGIVATDLIWVAGSTHAPECGDRIG